MRSTLKAFLSLAVLVAAFAFVSEARAQQCGAIAGTVWTDSTQSQVWSDPLDGSGVDVELLGSIDDVTYVSIGTQNTQPSGQFNFPIALCTNTYYRVKPHRPVNAPGYFNSKPIRLFTGSGSSFNWSGGFWFV